MANFYWAVNGGVWQDATNWAESSGGSGPASRYPQEGDVAIFEYRMADNGTCSLTADISVDEILFVHGTDVVLTTLGYSVDVAEDIHWVDSAEDQQDVRIELGDSVLTVQGNLLLYDPVVSGSSGSVSLRTGNATLNFYGDVTIDTNDCELTSTANYNLYGIDKYLYADNDGSGPYALNVFGSYTCKAGLASAQTLYIAEGATLYLLPPSLDWADSGQDLIFSVMTSFVLDGTLADPEDRDPDILSGAGLYLTQGCTMTRGESSIFNLGDLLISGGLYVIDTVIPPGVYPGVVSVFDAFSSDPHVLSWADGEYTIDYFQINHWKGELDFSGISLVTRAFLAISSENTPSVTLDISGAAITSSNFVLGYGFSPTTYSIVTNPSTMVTIVDVDDPGIAANQFYSATEDIVSNVSLQTDVTLLGGNIGYLTVAPGVTVTQSSEFDFLATGLDRNPLTIASEFMAQGNSGETIQWVGAGLELIVEGTSAVAWVNVQDSDASGGNSILAFDNCTDLGGNQNWIFPSQGTSVHRRYKVDKAHPYQVGENRREPSDIIWRNSGG